MRCLLCSNLSFFHICHTCQDNFLEASLFKRTVQNNIEVISFYKYEDIKSLLHTKHTDLGYYIFKILAKKSFQKFAQELNLDYKLISIAIDDKPKENYSHTAILNRALTSSSIQPKYNILRSTNKISYSGKSREFRVENSREFKLKKFDGDNIILVDDIITTGETLNQAIDLMQLNKKNVVFCLTLADVKF